VESGATDVEREDPESTLARYDETGKVTFKAPKPRVRPAVMPRWYDAQNGETDSLDPTGAGASA